MLCGQVPDITPGWDGCEGTSVKFSLLFLYLFPRNAVKCFSLFD